MRGDRAVRKLTLNTTEIGDGDTRRSHHFNSKLILKSEEAD
jgi:hypothetical protein